MSPKEVLRFWFGELQETNEYLAWRVKQQWFGGGPKVDEAVIREFGATHEAAMRGELDHWAEAPRGRLALILVLDQFSRHIYRNSPGAFEADAKALALCRKGIDLSHDRQVHRIERTFFYLPLEHAEDLAIQRESIAKYQVLYDESPPFLRDFFAVWRDYAIKHFDIIQRFSRFPHRNKILGRTSTPEEIEFLKGPNSSF